MTSHLPDLALRLLSAKLRDSWKGLGKEIWHVLPILAPPYPLNTAIVIPDLAMDAIKTLNLDYLRVTREVRGRA